MSTAGAIAHDSVFVQVLVAYDRDPNTHLPCARGGSAAHWGLVRGLAWPSNLSCEKVPGGDTADDSSLVALVSHTMSAHPFAVSFQDLAASNIQLHEKFVSSEIDGSLNGRPDAVEFPGPFDRGRWKIAEGGPDLAGFCLYPLLPPV